MGQLLTHKANDLVKYLIPKKFRLLLQSEKVTYQLRGMGEVLVAGGGRERQQELKRNGSRERQRKGNC